MTDLSVIKDNFLRTVLEESDNFKALSAEEQNKYLDRIVKLPEANQRELCKFFVREEKTKLPAKILMRFLKKVNDSMTALTVVAEKDKAIIKKYREGRKAETQPSIN